MSYYFASTKLTIGLLGLAQQFQYYHKLPHLRWLLPNAPHENDLGTTAWYTPKALSNTLKPRIPGRDEDTSDIEPDDEEGILKTCDKVDALVRGEIDRGVPGDRIVIGGFSQGCAISLVWGLVGKERKNVAGIVPLSGYFPLADRIAAIRKERGISDEKEGETVPWFLAHGNRDVLVSTKLFVREKEELAKWVDEKYVEEHLYDGMAHSTCNKELRDLLAFLTRVVPP